MLRYAVEDMTCGHCVQAITGAVQGLDPAARVAVDLGAKTVEVETSASADAVTQAIRDAGYTPEATGAAPAEKACCGHCH